MPAIHLEGKLGKITSCLIHSEIKEKKKVNHQPQQEATDNSQQTLNRSNNCDVHKIQTEKVIFSETSL